MSFIRPELRAALDRNQDRAIALAAALIGTLCLWRGLAAPAPLLTILGGGILALTLTAWIAYRQRAAFRQEVTQPGIVQIDEAQITYLTPEASLIKGGVVDRDALTRIDLISGGDGRARWAFYHTDGPPLSIPLAAAGADTLLDLLLTLPNVNVTAALAALDRGRPGSVPVWSRPPSSL